MEASSEQRQRMLEFQLLPERAQDAAVSMYSLAVLMTDEEHATVEDLCAGLLVGIAAFRPADPQAPARRLVVLLTDLLAAGRADDELRTLAQQERANRANGGTD